MQPASSAMHGTMPRNEEAGALRPTAPGVAGQDLRKRESDMSNATAAQALNFDLLDLMDHEKVIEQGLTTFIDVGNALVAIRDGKKYRAAGFDTFDDYCRRRWEISQQHAGNLMRAAALVKALETETTVSVLPTAETQVRPLTSLPREVAAEVWAEAVEEADGEQPTAKQVKAIVDRRKAPAKLEHPAVFSDAILDVAAAHLNELGVTGTVVDPFAGTGRIHELRDKAPVTTIGVEIEPEWAAKHPDTVQGNALALTDTIAPGTADAIVTSPTYGNRMADHHEARDDSVRNTYTHTLGRQLNPDNSGQMQWGDEYRTFHRKAWADAVAVLRPGGTFTLDCKNHIRAGQEQRVVEWHINTLMHDFGLTLEALDIVPTKGLPSGANAGTRTLFELVATFRKP